MSGPGAASAKAKPNGHSGAVLPNGAGWQAALLRTDKGKPKPLMENVRIALESAPELSGVVACDEFTNCTVMRSRPPWRRAGIHDWSEEDDLELVSYLQRLGVDAGMEVVGRGVQLAAAHNKVHPIREWFESGRWDGIHRVDSWLTKYLGAKDDPYTRTVGRLWLISLIARVYEPGCQVDYMLVLEGPQGIGKSSALRILAGGYFTDSLADLRDKDSRLQLSGKLIVEMAELDTFYRTDNSLLKTFLSCTHDVYRPPYGKRTASFPRQCVFAGTTNDATYLRDASNRRYWPVKCGSIGSIDLEALARDRDQLFCEALELHRNGHKWHPTEQAFHVEAAARQSAREDTDIWLPVVEAYVADNDFVTVGDVLQKSDIQKQKQTWTQSDQNRIARCLLHLGWTRVRKGQEPRVWGYAPPAKGPAGPLFELRTELQQALENRNLPFALRPELIALLDKIEAAEEKIEKEAQSAGE